MSSMSVYVELSDRLWLLINCHPIGLELIVRPFGALTAPPEPTVNASVPVEFWMVSTFNTLVILFSLSH
jgi:hypothetical protein